MQYLVRWVYEFTVGWNSPCDLDIYDPIAFECVVVARQGRRALRVKNLGYRYFAIRRGTTECAYFLHGRCIMFRSVSADIAMSIKKLAVAILVASSHSSLAHAAVVEVFAVPTHWKLENYTGGSVAVWNTGSPCNGWLGFSQNASSEDHSRLFAVILAAKAQDRPIFVRYDNVSCELVSFGMGGP